MKEVSFIVRIAFIGFYESAMELFNAYGASKGDKEKADAKYEKKKEFFYKAIESEMGFNVIDIDYRFPDGVSVLLSNGEWMDLDR